MKTIAQFVRAAVVLKSARHREFVALHFLHRQNPTAAGDLAERMEIDAGQLTRVLNSMRKRGLILTAISEADQRRRMIHLRDLGISRYGQLIAKVNEDGTCF